MKTTDERKSKLLEGLKDGLIVSCQVQHDDPIYTDDMVVKMAEAAAWAGAVAIRANSPEQIKAIKEKVELPIIGLWKVWHDDSEVFITPTMKEVKAIWEAGAQIIALDCTA
ncbi:MAG: N-acetylmannosamine-6-phosphate 2-epimerase, partial [Longicatena sp.]